VLQDFFNEYNTVLSDHGIVVDVPSLDHPFYERRRQFISEAIPSLPGPRRRGGS